MERLATREPRANGMPGVCCTHFGCGDCQTVLGHCFAGCLWEDAVWERLAAYEDIGLTPEEINEFLHQSYGPLHKKLVEWIVADQDGRLVVQPPNAPLTLDELREMDDADVWVAYPKSADGEQLIMHALVEVVKENGVVWLTNNLGGRSTFDEVSEDGGLAYRRKPEEVK